jgi:YD repeat-containing protein
MLSVNYPDHYESYGYDALGEVIQHLDGNNNLHVYSYDAAGRLTSDYVKSFGTNVDKAVAKLLYSYNALGQLTVATSQDQNYAIVNQVSNVYNGLGQLSIQYQAVNGSVTPGTYKVQYFYDQSNNDSRLTEVVYPNGRAEWYGYSAVTMNGNNVDNSISRVDSISDGTGSPGQTLETYSYLGLNQVIGMSMPQPGISETTALDTFGNIASVAWTKGAQTLDAYQYGYDANGNVLYRNNAGAVLAGNAYFGESYTYDQLNQMSSYSRGVLTGQNVVANPGPASMTFAPDSTGNQTGGYYDLAKLYSYYTQLGAPQPIVLNSENQTDTILYDAWGRAVSMAANGVNAYRYDALGRRVSDSSGSGMISLYDGANVVEERSFAGNVLQQYVWSAAGGSLIVLRDQGGSRIYALHDAAGSTTSITDAAGVVKEHYAYTAGGIPVAYSLNWASLPGGPIVDPSQTQFNWSFLWHGLRWHDFYPDSGGNLSGAGLYDSMSNGQWYDPQHLSLVQPTPQPHPGETPYDPYNGETGITGFLDRSAGDIATMIRMGSWLVPVVGLTVNSIASAHERYLDGQSFWHSVFGGMGDTTGVSGIYNGVEDHSLTEFGFGVLQAGLTAFGLSRPLGVLSSSLSGSKALIGVSGRNLVAAENAEIRLNILNPGFVPTQDAIPGILDGITNQVVNRLSSNPNLAMQFLTPDEMNLLNSGNGSPNLMKALVGNVVERGVAADIRAFEPSAQLFQYTKDVPALRGTSIWDFTGIGPAEGHIFEVTTPGDVAAHSTRWYGDLVHYSTYQWP